MGHCAPIHGINDINTEFRKLLQAQQGMSLPISSCANLSRCNIKDKVLYHMVELNFYFLSLKKKKNVDKNSLQII